jgi:sugar phosphate isomerase/epimerase
MDVTRRAFLSSTALASTSLLINPNKAMAEPNTLPPASPGYELLMFATNWGYTGSWKDFCALIKKEGYDGAEVWCPADAAQRDALVATFKDHNLKIGFLVGGWEKDVDKHFKQFEESLRTAAKLQPVYINCHSGRDFYSFEQNRKFIDLTTAVNRESGVPIYHETHRSRILYSAPVSKQFMEELPSLRLTLDISHWCNVHESLLEDQQETVDLAVARAEHIHARVGHQEGPQVSDPRAPEWKNTFEKHLGWWDQVVSRKKKEGQRMTILTEFGPVDYMPAMPYTRQPIANQWDINVYMMKTLRARYQ